MSDIDNGGPAFPFNENNSDGTHYHSHGGMTLRDWFAGQALAGFAASMRAGDAWETVAMEAYAMADAMISEREKGRAS